VNPQAVAHARSIGARLETVYPEGVRRVRALAPDLLGGETTAAKDFVEATGLSFEDIYPRLPRPSFGNESAIVARNIARPFRLWWLVGAVLGFVGGAIVGAGPAGAAAGVAAGALLGGRR
jgi:hypothetical protein